MPATLSNESRIASGLRVLNCSGRSLVRIAKNCGVQISDGPFSEGMRTSLDLATAEKLLSILERMRELQDSITEAADGVTINIDWRQIEKVSRALTMRLVQDTARQLKIEDPRFDAIAAKAIKDITTNVP